ncbi:hypothetical protein PPBDW_II0952 [Photobacterium kishitanii]|nr:hypothetical protein PPBDW_II0952 [Photobacterium kishitanii]
MLRIIEIRQYNPLDKHKKANELPSLFYISRGVTLYLTECMVIY